MRRCRGPVLVAVSVVVALVAGCGGDTHAPAAPGAGASKPAQTPDGAESPSPDGEVSAELDPATLRRGPDPGLSWYDVPTRTLHQGSRTTRVEVMGTVDSVAAAGDSELLVVSDSHERRVVVRVDADGSTAVLARSRAASAAVVVATDGRTFAWVGLTGRRTPVKVVSVADGHRVAGRRLVASQLRVLALTPDRALVSSHRATVWWNLHDGSVRPLAPDLALAATTRGDRLALLNPKTDRSRVTDTSTGSVWSLPRMEDPVAFTADGSLILTGRDREADFRGYDVYQRPLRVRDAGTGQLRATFDGRFGWYDTGGARWEDDDHFLAVARDPRSVSGDGTMRRSWVRCSVTTASCEAAGPVERANLTVPPYGQLERLVSGQLAE